MHNYLPDYLYKMILKSPQREEYLKLAQEIGEINEMECKSLSARLQLENIDVIIHSSERYSSIFYRLRKLINDAFPDDIGFDITRGKYSRDQLLEMYKDLTWDTTKNAEVAAICIQEIIKQSYIDGTYIDYMKVFLKGYHSIPNSIRPQLPTYLCENYLQSSILVYLEELRKEEPDNWLEVCDKLMHIYHTAMNTSHIADKDSISQEFGECLADFIQAMMSSPNIEKYMAFVYEMLFCRMSFQHDNYSYGKIRILSAMAHMNLNKGNNTEFVNTFYELVQYISRAYTNVPMFIRGMTYFDTMNIDLYFAIIRWILGVTRECPFFSEDMSQMGTLKNLPLDDYALATMTIEELKQRKEYNEHTVEFFKDVDRWFNDKNIEYINMKNINR